jgi:hypothetical protein
MSDLAPLIDIGEDTARAAADLLSDILAAMETVSAAQTGTNTAEILDRVRQRAFTSRRDDPRARARALAHASQTRLSALAAFGARRDALETALQADISSLKQILEGQTNSTPEDIARRTLAERRGLYLAAVEASLARCRILLQQLLRGEHACDDALGIMRDVTVPMAARDAALTDLAQAADAARALGDESDQLCRELLHRGAKNLARKRQK